MLPLDPAQHIVTAVIVTHDGARWLPETLKAVREQSRPVQRVVGVDTGSRDRSGAILAEFIASDAIATLSRDTGFGDAVRAGLDLPRLRAAFPGAAPDSTEWIWLVHDDCVPGPDTLRTLLLAANDDPRAAVLGPKLRDWFDPQQLVEAGVTIDGAGRRETGLEPRELDHGQHDGTRQVLAVSSAGMLVRRDVWDQLGGYDARLPLFRDDIDFCWRAGGAGHRTLLVTDAVARHAEAAARRRRNASAASGHPRRADRRNALFVLLANLPFGGMVGALARNSFASLFRVLMYIVAKQPAHALDEAVAIVSVYARPGRLIAARFRRRRDRRRTYSAIRPFLARGVALRQFTDMISNVLAGSPAVETSGRHQAVTTPPETEDDEPLRSGHGPLRRFLSRPGVLLVLCLTAVALVAERSLLAGDRIAGGALPPVWGGASDLWNLYLAGWHDVGVGTGAAAPPYVGLLALLSTVTLGSPWLAVALILVGSVPLASLTAFLLARRVLRFRPARWWMAGSYALLPMATGAVAQGRVGTALVHALLPVLGLLVLRMLSAAASGEARPQARRRSRRATWALALFLAVATALVPLVWVLALISGGLVVASFWHLGRGVRVSVGIALVAPLVLLLPWSAQLFAHPSLWLLEAGLHRPELSAPAAAPESLLLLSPGGPGTPPSWVTVGFVAAALSALVLLRRRMLVAVGWGMALFGILVAVVVSRVTVEPPFGGPAAPAWPGVALAFAGTAMLWAAAIAAQSFGIMWMLGGMRRMFALVAAAFAVTTPLLAAGLWMWDGSGEVDGDAPPSVPALVSAQSDDGARARTLVVSPEAGGSVSYSVLRGREPRFGEEQIPPDRAAGHSLSMAVAGLSAGRGGDEADSLAAFGIRYLLVPRPDSGAHADRGMVDTLDGTPGVSRMSLTEEFALWRLDQETGRLRVTGDGAPQVLATGPGGNSARVPEGGSGRTLTLAEPATAGWTATLDGEPLRPARARPGLQAFDLPSSGGRLELTHDTGSSRQVWLVAQGALLAVVAALALPGARTEDDTDTIDSGAQPTPRPRRPRRRGGHRHRGRRGREKGDRA